jgi:hypothetical protein
MNKTDINTKQFLTISGCLLTLWTAWFAPIVSSKWMTNAYGLNYMGVDISSLYVNLGLFIGVSFPLSWYIDNKGIKSSVSAKSNLHSNPFNRQHIV